MFPLPFYIKGGKKLKVKDIYNDVLALTLEKEADNSEFADFVVPHFNLLMAELFNYNNAARQRSGKQTLAAAARVESLNDDVPYEDVLYAPMVYGLAAKLLTADENELAGTYQQMYYSALESAFTVESETVVDVYAESDD